MEQEYSKGFHISDVYFMSLWLYYDFMGEKVASP